MHSSQRWSYAEQQQGSMRFYWDSGRDQKFSSWLLIDTKMPRRNIWIPISLPTAITPSYSHAETWCFCFLLHLESGEGEPHANNKNRRENWNVMILKQWRMVFLIYASIFWSAPPYLWLQKRPPEESCLCEVTLLGANSNMPRVEMLNKQRSTELKKGLRKLIMSSRIMFGCSAD